MKAQQLKNSILQMAVQGKLVPQDPNDEPAAVLLERIRAEKQQLVKEGKIKKPKSESLIYRVPREGDDATDNLPYAVLVYDLPAGWELCRLIDLYNFIDYRGATPNKISSGVPFVTAKNVKSGYTDYSISEFISLDSYEKRKSRGISQKGDILFTTEAPLGNVALADLAEFSAGQRLITLQNYSANVPLNNMLFMNFLLSDFFKQQLKERQTGTTVKGIKAEKLKELIIPLPPLAEQQRIVERIAELLPHIAAYDTAEQKLTALNATFPASLKKSILHAAVQGKLVAQDAADEPASVLLERIRAEKETLIKAGKIKRNKHESVIFRRDNSHYEKLDGIERCIDDEIPFDIPENWAWTRLGNLGFFIRGNGIKRSDIQPNGVPCVRYGEIYTIYNIAMTDAISFVDEAIADKSKIVGYGDLLLTLTGESKEEIGKTVAFLGKNKTVIGGDLATFTNHQQNPMYLSYLMNSPYAIQEKMILGTGDIIVHISCGKLAFILIPLPPIAEQRRIVSSIESLTGKVDKL